MSELKEVVVKSTRVKMVMKGDTIVFDAAAFVQPEGSMLEYLVKQLPGVTVSNEGVISYNGRRLKELLLNGKDFFSGDPKVALQNLPSYTVKNIKIYDKESHSAYLTGSNQRINDDESSQNLVLDVNLKKEYIRSKMGNAEAGYGTSDRYKARFFGMAMGEELRVSLFGKANNIGDASWSSLNGTWNGGWGLPGYNNQQGGGADYLYESKDRKTMASGSLTVKRDERHQMSQASSTLFFPTKDLYRRGGSDSRTTDLNIETKHDIRLKKESFMFEIEPEVSWKRNSKKQRDAHATFDAFPDENYRGEALDSVLAGSQGYTRSLLTRLLQLKNALSKDFNANMTATLILSPRSWKGTLDFGARGAYTRTTSDSRDVYSQLFGAANTDATHPVQSDRFGTDRPHSGSVTAYTAYSQRFTRFGERYSRQMSFSVNLRGDHDERSYDKLLYNSDSLPDLNVLPSTNMPAFAIADLENSYNSKQTSNTLAARAAFMINFEPTHQSEKGFNPSIYLSMSLGYSHSAKHLNYVRPETDVQNVNRSFNEFAPNIYLTLSSANKMRNTNISFIYNSNTMAPQMTYFLSNVANSDPMQIITGAKGNLKSTTTHTFNIRFNNFVRGSSPSTLTGNATVTLFKNSIANAQTYNEMTGVTVGTPVNINGNWRGQFNVEYSFSFGKEKQFDFTSTFMANLNHSVDYITLHTTPERSTVMNTDYSPSVRLGYKFGKGSNIMGGFRFTGARQTSKRSDFNNLTHFDYKPWTSLHLVLPAGFSFDTELTVKMNRGYQNENMNINQWLWNVTASKSFMKGSLIMKLTCVDLLDSVKDVSTTVNAQGRYELVNKMIPRYAMLSLHYNFDTMKKRR